jgi:hypothetical protein
LQSERNVVFVQVGHPSRTDVHGGGIAVEVAETGKLRIPFHQHNSGFPGLVAGEMEFGEVFCRISHFVQVNGIDSKPEVKKFCKDWCFKIFSVSEIVKKLKVDSSK